jgi:hypothetical protein
MEVYMNRIRIAIAIALTLVITGITTPFTSAATKPKSAGRTSSSIPNTILSGKGAPNSTLGIDGDFYIDTRSLLIYGPKKNKKWPNPQSLQGPIGASGVDGKNGSEGKTISSASNIAGPSGTQGDKGEKGDKGEIGAAGSTGAAGAAGVAGATGPTGLTGSSGSGGGTAGPTGATGPTGAQGLIGVTGAKGETGTVGSLGTTGAKGETGTVGSLGTTGAKGETGTVGAIGPSNVYKGNFNFPDISGGVGTSQISTLSGFKAGNSYLVTLAIVTYQPTRNVDALLPMGLAITNNIGTAIIWYSYQSIKGISYRNGLGSGRIEYVTAVQVTLDGTSSIDYSINLQLSVGLDTNANLARSEVSYVSTLVGSIGSL